MYVSDLQGIRTYFENTQSSYKIISNLLKKNMCIEFRHNMSTFSSRNYIIKVKTGGAYPVL